MTADQLVQDYLSDHPQGDAAEWRHTIDPLDYDDCPFQALAYGPGAPHTTTQEPQNGASGLPDPGTTPGDHPATGGPADAASAVSTGVPL